jgi:hypothetical protein
MLAVLFGTVCLFAPIDFWIISFSNILTLGVPDEGYSRAESTWLSPSIRMMQKWWDKVWSWNICRVRSWRKVCRVGSCRKVCRVETWRNVSRVGSWRDECRVGSWRKVCRVESWRQICWVHARLSWVHVFFVVFSGSCFFVFLLFAVGHALSIRRFRASDYSFWYLQTFRVVAIKDRTHFKPEF